MEKYKIYLSNIVRTITEKLLAKDTVESAFGMGMFSGYYDVLNIMVREGKACDISLEKIGLSEQYTEDLIKGVLNGKD